MTEEQEKAYPEIAREARDEMPRSFLQFGFTTLIDLVSTPEAMMRWKHHDSVPDTYFCGGAALMDGYPMNFVPKSSRYQNWPYMIIEAASTAELPPGIQAVDHTPQAVVARMKADGAICVKTFFDRGIDPKTSLPVPRRETIQALVRAAHEAGLPVLLHASSTEAHAFGLDADVDDMAHGLWNWGTDPSGGGLTPEVKAALDREIQSQLGWQPTFRIGLGFRDLFLSSFLSDPTLTRVLPQRLIEWYRTQDVQQFHGQMASLLSLASNDHPKVQDAARGKIPPRSACRHRWPG